MAEQAERFPVADSIRDVPLREAVRDLWERSRDIHDGQVSPGSLSDNGRAHCLRVESRIHELIQNGPDIEVTVAIFDETEAVNPDGKRLPGLDAAYTLKRWAYDEETEFLFENRVFDPAAAGSVSGYTCHVWDWWNEEDCEEGGGLRRLR